MATSTTQAGWMVWIKIGDNTPQCLGVNGRHMEPADVVPFDTPEEAGEAGATFAATLTDPYRLGCSWDVVARGSYAVCVSCQQLLQVCCDSGYDEQPDGTVTHSDPRCWACCHGRQVEIL